MGSIAEIMQLCRLCLVKDQVNVPIFDEQGVVKQILPKITACLPVKITKDDSLPKRICDGCSYKLDICYQFHNTSVKAEKQLQTWLTELAAKEREQEQPKIVLKQETIELPADIETEDSISTDAQSYILQQQQLPYPNIEFIDQSDYDGVDQPVVGTSEADVAEESVEPPTKRQRRAAAQKAIDTIVETESDEEIVDDVLEGKVAKLENDSDNDEDVQPPTFVGVPADADQPGPSGVGKSTETPFLINQALAPNDNIYLCQECGATIVGTYKKYYLHCKSHTARTFICPICGKSFHFGFMLRQHMKYHNTERPYLCEHCNKTYKTQTCLSLHIRRSHTGAEETFPCSLCGKEYKCKTFLEEHTMKVHEGFSYKCDQCEKTYLNKMSFDNHVKTHASDFQLNCCDLCDKKFTSAFLLRKHHRNLHDKRTSYVCETCGKVVSTATSLRDHRSKHEGERKCICHECGKGFYTNRHLTIHLRIHTKEKPYICKTCGKRFSQRSTLTTHIRALHTKERPHVCQICSSAFVTRTLLRTHITKIHNGVSMADILVADKVFQTND